MKIAACLIVRNEECHIDEWLAWYHIAGFDTCIVVDHGSTDTTWHKIHFRGNYQDIRVHKLSTHRGLGNEGPHTQISTYDTVCKLYSGEFDWIGFFDLDEFLVVHHHGGIRHLLCYVPQTASQLHIRWALFGSNHHIIKPSGMMIEDYQKRVDVSFDKKLLGKSIVRPYEVGHWPNPHAAVTINSTVDANYQPITWDQYVGDPSNYADYSTAQLNHYYLRSWEHWLERMQKRKLWNDETKNVRSAEQFKLYDEACTVIDAQAAEKAPLIRDFLKNHVPNWMNQYLG